MLITKASNRPDQDRRAETIAAAGRRTRAAQRRSADRRQTLCCPPVRVRGGAPGTAGGTSRHFTSPHVTSRQVTSRHVTSPTCQSIVLWDPEFDVCMYVTGDVTTRRMSQATSRLVVQLSKVERVRRQRVFPTKVRQKYRVECEQRIRGEFFAHSRCIASILPQWLFNKGNCD